MVGAIIGDIAEARWGVPDKIRDVVPAYLPEEMQNIINPFYETYITI